MGTLPDSTLRPSDGSQRDIIVSAMAIKKPRSWDSTREKVFTSIAALFSAFEDVAIETVDRTDRGNLIAHFVVTARK